VSNVEVRERRSLSVSEEEEKKKKQLIERRPGSPPTRIEMAPSHESRTRATSPGATGDTTKTTCNDIVSPLPLSLC